jgi:hypothetical protein
MSFYSWYKKTRPDMYGIFFFEMKLIRAARQQQINRPDPNVVSFLSPKDGHRLTATRWVPPPPGRSTLLHLSMAARRSTQNLPSHPPAFSRALDSMAVGFLIHSNTKPPPTPACIFEGSRFHGCWLPYPLPQPQLRLFHSGETYRHARLLT